MSEETAVYQVAKKSSMHDKTRARNYYAAAVSLFQDPTADDCERAIELLNKAVDFYPDFSEAYCFRGDVWHHLLKSLDPDDNNGTYEEYRKSPAWKVKRDAVRQRDGGQCICGAQATELHHKTYDNIGREPLSDLVMLCEECHERVHQPRVPSDHQSAIQHPVELQLEVISVKEAFIAYVNCESNILQLVDSGTTGHRDYVDYEMGYPKENGYHQIWMSAWLPVGRNDITALISIQSDSRYFESHYKKFEEHKYRIEETFSFEEVKLRTVGKVSQLRVVKKNVDWTQAVDRDTAFRWLRENLEKLYWVLRVHDALGWHKGAVG